MGLARADPDDQRPALAVDELVDLGRQSPARTPESVIRWLDPQIRVIRLSPLCGPQMTARPGSCWWRAGEHG